MKLLIDIDPGVWGLIAANSGLDIPLDVATKAINSIANGKRVQEDITKGELTKIWSETTATRYKEILKLKEMLEKNSIPFRFSESFGGYHIEYPFPYTIVLGRRSKELICSVIEHDGSYGHEEDLLEIMGLLTEEEKEYGSEVAGWLTAENVYERISKDWEVRKNEKRV